jgi:hypothetical protein
VRGIEDLRGGPLRRDSCTHIRRDEACHVMKRRINLRSNPILCQRVNQCTGHLKALYWRLLANELAGGMKFLNSRPYE